MSAKTSGTNKMSNALYPSLQSYNASLSTQSHLTACVAHGRVVTSSRQITEVKQRRARLVLGWVTAARVTLPAMCRGVGQAFHIMPPLSTQQ